MPTLRQLRQFLAAAEAESLSKAASLLGTVPSALSAQITALEAELGCRLFRRDGRGVHPTEEGLELKRHVRRILDAAHELKDEIANPGRAIAGEVRLGLLPWLCRAMAALLMGEARARFPELGLVLRDGRSGELAEALAGGALDLASLHAHEARAEHRALALGDSGLCVAGPVGAWPTGGGPMGFAEAARLPLILESQRHGLRTVLEEAARAEGIALAPAFEVDSDAATMALIEAGQGYAILPYAGIEGRIAAVGLAGGPAAPIVLARSVRNRQTAAAGALARLVQELAAGVPRVPLGSRR
ncbi:MAG TPA: LysR family transcriptional regulator [Acetobacteraceae bacterium]|jgi:LysR family transcriptional regulator, nitrogen assimilation regulatory protein|nr:LysR family transcriptional regulator [Acetobacteraceae bacterium]